MKCAWGGGCTTVLTTACWILALYQKHCAHNCQSELMVLRFASQNRYVSWVIWCGKVTALVLDIVRKLDCPNEVQHGRMVYCSFDNYMLDSSTKSKTLCTGLLVKN